MFVIRAELIPSTIQQLKDTGSGKKLGALIKEKHKGKLIDEWNAA
jgi:hypothetical protein